MKQDSTSRQHRLSQTSDLIKILLDNEIRFLDNAKILYIIKENLSVEISLGKIVSSIRIANDLMKSYISDIEFGDVLGV